MALVRGGRGGGPNQVLHGREVHVTREGDVAVGRVQVMRLATAGQRAV